MHDDLPLLHKKRWGPNFWVTIHTVAASYPNTPSADDRKHAYTFISNMPDLLPCPECGRHMRTMLRNGAEGLESLHSPQDPRLNSRESFFGYTVAMHNVVNERLGKPRRDVQDVVDEYYGARATPFEKAPAVPEPLRLLPTKPRHIETYRVAGAVVALIILYIVLMLAVGEWKLGAQPGPQNGKQR